MRQAPTTSLQQLDTGARSLEPLHPAEIALLQLIRQIRFGRIEVLMIADGLPVSAERPVERTQFL